MRRGRSGRLAAAAGTSGAAPPAAPARCPLVESEDTMFDVDNACAAAARGGHPEVLQWARQQGCPWGSINQFQHVSTSSTAAGAGHLALLQWARQQGCPWDQETCAAAVRGEHLEVLQWAWQHGCPYSQESLGKALLEHHHVRVAPFLLQDVNPWGPEACSTLSGRGFCGALQCARQLGFPWDDGHLPGSISTAFPGIRFGLRLEGVARSPARGPAGRAGGAHSTVDPATRRSKPRAPPALPAPGTPMQRDQGTGGDLLRRPGAGQGRQAPGERGPRRCRGPYPGSRGQVRPAPRRSALDVAAVLYLSASQPTSSQRPGPVSRGAPQAAVRQGRGSEVSLDRC
jgi:hypothetical protein